MNQYHDCVRAKHAFEQESAVARASPVWLDEAARASECSGDLAAALNYYDLELKKLPDTPRLVQKIGDLRYKQYVQAQQAQTSQAAAEAAAEQQRQQALDTQRKQQQQAIRDAQNIAAARANVDQEVQQLARLLESDFKVDWDYPDSGSTVHHHIKRHVTEANHCELTFTDQDDKAKRITTVHIPFANATAEFPATDGYNIDIPMGGWVKVSFPGGLYLFVAHQDSQPWEIAHLINQLARGCSP